MASPVHPALEPVPALERDSRPGAETLGHTEDSDEDAMSEYSAQAVAQDGMEVGLAEGTVGALLSLDKAEEEDFLDELKELCELSKKLGDSEEAFRDRARDYIKASVAEIYSPPRVTKAATMLPRLGIEPGAALDITTCDERGVPWDFTKEEMRRKAEKLLDETKPDLLVGSPMCTKFSSWQRISWRRTRDPRRFKQERAEAVEHLEFVCQLYRK